MRILFQSKIEESETYEELVSYRKRIMPIVSRIDTLRAFP
jgi:hypothetical protein